MWYLNKFTLVDSKNNWINFQKDLNEENVWVLWEGKSFSGFELMNCSFLLFFYLFIFLLNKM
jgi:hypothetical protein